MSPVLVPLDLETTPFSIGAKVGEEVLIGPFDQFNRIDLVVVDAG